MERLGIAYRPKAEEGDDIPEPSTIDEVANDPAIKGALAFLVSADLERAVRANVTARKSQIDAIDRRAREAGMTRSAYMALFALGRDLGKTRSGQKRIVRD